jgi:hypothetical protein
MTSDLSLAELAEAVTAGAPDDMNLVMRRVRHWTVAGIMPTEGEVHAGTGRHRRYPRSSVHLTLVLTRMADFGLSIGLLKMTSMVLQSASMGMGRGKRWQEAVTGKREIYCLFAADKSSASQTITDAANNALLTEEQIIERMKKSEAGILINLTALFRGISA